MSMFQSEPLQANTPRPTLAGDWHDDDGQVIDDLVQPQANPLPPPATDKTVPVTERPARVGRLIGGTGTWDPQWQPFLALPADPRRKSVTIQNNSTTATDGVRIADDSGKCQSGTGAGVVYPANPLTLLGYTGPVWISAAPAAAAVTVSMWAVTE